MTRKFLTEHPVKSEKLDLMVDRVKPRFMVHGFVHGSVHGFIHGLVYGLVYGTWFMVHGVHHNVLL